jgi:hypothetical protein
LFDFGVRCGANPARLSAAAGLPTAMLNDPDKRVGYGRFIALMWGRSRRRETQRWLCGSGRTAISGSGRWWGSLRTPLPTMTEALVQLNRYGRLVVETEGLAQGPRFANAARDGAFWLYDNRLNPNDFPELTESTWLRFIVHSRKNSPDHVFDLGVEVTHPKPAHWRAYEEIWRVPVTFGAARNAIRMNPAWPAVRIAPDNRYAFGVLSEKAQALFPRARGAGDDARAGGGAAHGDAAHGGGRERDDRRQDGDRPADPCSGA